MRRDEREEGRDPPKSHGSRANTYWVPVLSPKMDVRFPPYFFSMPHLLYNSWLTLNLPKPMVPRAPSEVVPPVKVTQKPIPKIQKPKEQKPQKSPSPKPSEPKDPEDTEVSHPSTP